MQRKEHLLQADAECCCAALLTCKRLTGAEWASTSSTVSPLHGTTQSINVTSVALRFTEEFMPAIHPKPLALVVVFDRLMPQDTAASSGYLPFCHGYPCSAILDHFPWRHSIWIFSALQFCANAADASKLHNVKYMDAVIDATAMQVTPYTHSALCATCKP
jgi:hypothetical protein